MTNFADRTIWNGDNLDILRGLSSASVDLIYLDPPFNSNRNYAAPVGSAAAGVAFKDTWTRDLHKYLWELPTPKYNGAVPLHREISEAGAGAAPGAAGRLEDLRAQFGEQLTVTIARRGMRAWPRD